MEDRQPEGGDAGYGSVATISLPALFKVSWPSMINANPPGRLLRTESTALTRVVRAPRRGLPRLFGSGLKPKFVKLSVPSNADIAADVK